MTTPTDVEPPRTARRYGLWTMRSSALVLLVWGVHAAFALPSCPSTVWARVDLPIRVKPWADVRLTPSGDSTPGDAWFRNVDRSYAHHQEAWSPRTRIEIERETPLARQAFQQLLHGRHDCRRTIATCRPSGATEIAGGRTWARYVRED